MGPPFSYGNGKATFLIHINDGRAPSVQDGDVAKEKTPPTRSSTSRGDFP